MKFMICVNIDI